MANIQYFLGANSPQGFYSLYDQLIRAEDASAIYILKGGPGCGKSTFMRRVGRQAEQAGLPVEYILCSGDPASLDAVLLPTLGAALVDGTAPHVVEPKYPGVVERYVNLGECYDTAALGAVRGEIMDCMKGYKGCYQRAYRCLEAAAQIRTDMRCTLLTPELEAKIEKRSRGILAREISRKKQAAPGPVRQRFLTAVTHAGPLALFGTAEAQCSRIYALQDSCALGHTMLAHLLAGASAAGYEVVACPSPMAPERLEHLIIPELKLAFLTSSPTLPYSGRPYRRVRLDAMADTELLRRTRPRLRFSRKVSDALLEEAVSSLAQAKAMHDDLERIYNPHVDFERVHQTADAISRELLS